MPDNQTIERFRLMTRIYSDLSTIKIPQLLESLEGFQTENERGVVSPVIQALESIRDSSGRAAIQAQTLWDEGRHQEALRLLKAINVSIERTIRDLREFFSTFGTPELVALHLGIVDSVLETTNAVGRVVDDVTERIESLARSSFDAGKALLLVGGAGLGLWLFFKYKGDNS